jgi:hypothetical protein
VLRLLEWKGQLRRGSLTAIKASKEVFALPYESNTSFEPYELQFYSDKIHGCMSLHDIKVDPRLSYFQEDMSNSVTIREEEKKVLQKKLEKGLFYDSK